MECKYCMNRIDNLKTEDSRFEVYIDTNVPEIDIMYDGFEEGGQCGIKINYCPMCGRKLEDEKEN